MYGYKWTPLDRVHYNLEGSDLHMKFNLETGYQPWAIPTDIRVCTLLEDEPISRDALERDGWHHFEDKLYQNEGWQSKEDANEPGPLIIIENHGKELKVYAYDEDGGGVRLKYCALMGQLREALFHLTGKTEPEPKKKVIVSLEKENEHLRSVCREFLDSLVPVQPETLGDAKDWMKRKAKAVQAIRDALGEDYYENNKDA